MVQEEGERRGREMREKGELGGGGERGGRGKGQEDGRRE